MKLFYSAGSCSTSCHISLEESGLKYEAVPIDWDKTDDPNIALVTKLNPMGTLPVMVTNDGKVLDQNLGIHTYIAEQVPEKNLIPKQGTFEKAVVVNWLSFIASDLHKSFSPLFALKSIGKSETSQEDVRQWSIKSVNNCLKYIDGKLAGKEYLTGSTFTIADAYCFVVLGWCNWLEISLDPYKNVKAYLDRVAKRPAVHKVLSEEGLLE